MTSSPKLFNIIKSLTPSEKRYFKIFASRHVIGKKNNYEKLFDALEALPDEQPYDEAAFKLAHKGKPWVKNLAVEKNQLEDLVLTAMRNYHAEKTEEGKLDNEIANLTFLFDKGLIEEADKILHKALLMAEEQENLSRQIILYQYKQQIRNGTQLESFGNTQYSDFEKESKLIKMLETERKIIHLNRQVHLLYLTDQLKNQQMIDSFLQSLHQFDANQNLLSTVARSYQLYTHAFILEKQEKYEDARKLYLKQINIWNHLTKIMLPFKFRKTVLANYLHCCLMVEKFDEIPHFIDKIESLTTKTFLEKAEQFRSSKHFKLLYHLNTNDSENVLLIKEIEDGLTKYKAFISFKATINFRFNICLTHLKHNKFDSLIKSIGDIYALIGREETQKTVIRNLKFIEIWAHIKGKDFLLADNQLSNTERWLRDNKLNNDFTSTLIKCLRHSMGSPSKKKSFERLTEVNCPNDLSMLKEIFLTWK